MAELPKDIASKFETLWFKSGDVFDLENIEPSVKYLTEAWNLLPENKDDFIEGYYCSKDFSYIYLRTGDLVKALEWCEIFLKCDNKNRNYGESEFMRGRIAFEAGKHEESIDYFVVAEQKGGKRIWRGEEQKYKDYYDSSDLPALKIAELKAAEKALKKALKDKNKSLSSENLKALKNESTRFYTNYSTNKVCYITRDGNRLITETGKPEKTTARVKEFKDENSAKVGFQKKQWEIQRKGFVYLNASAKPGQAMMHYHNGNGYTGALPFVHTPDGIYVYRLGWDNNTPKEDIKDYLDLIDTEGHLIDTLELPGALPWETMYSTETGLLHMRLDSDIYAYNGVSKSFTKLTHEKEFSHKKVAIGGQSVAFSTKNDFRFFAKSSDAHANAPTIQIPRLSDRFSFALSRDGKLLVTQNENTIEVTNTTTGTKTATFHLPTSSIDQMEITKDNKTLIYIDKEDYWNVRFHDLNSGEEINYEDIAIPDYEYAQYYCVNDDNTLLAISYRNSVRVFDFEAKNQLYEFDFDHGLKKTKIKFIGNTLGARTDSGCFSLYKM